jgi:hypothetical protein
LALRYLLLCCVNGENFAHLEHEIIGQEGDTQVILQNHSHHVCQFQLLCCTVYSVYTYSQALQHWGNQQQKREKKLIVRQLLEVTYQSPVKRCVYNIFHNIFEIYKKHRREFVPYTGHSWHWMFARQALQKTKHLQRGYFNNNSTNGYIEIPLLTWHKN